MNFKHKRLLLQYVMLLAFILLSLPIFAWLKSLGPRPGLSPVVLYMHMCTFGFPVAAMGIYVRWFTSIERSKSWIGRGVEDLATVLGLCLYFSMPATLFFILPPSIFLSIGFLVVLYALATGSRVDRQSPEAKTVRITLLVGGMLCVPVWLFAFAMTVCFFCWTLPSEFYT